MRCRSCLQVVTVTAIVAGIASVCAARCLDDPTDAGFVEVARTTIGESCPCGLGSTDRAGYRRCVRGLVKQAVLDGMLPRSCRRLVIKSAKESVCGRPGRVPCCLPGADGAPMCRMTGADSCPGTIGASDSCYDACSDVPSCDNSEAASPFANEEALVAARDAATDKWTNAGREADYADDVFRRWLHAQLAIEMGCRDDLPAGRPTTAGAARAGLSVIPPGPCASSDCVGEYDAQVKYCGFGQGHLYNVRCDECANQACWRHDGCTGERCIRRACQFQGNEDCDPCFFDQTSDCLSLARSDCQHGLSRRCSAATCMERIRGIARWWGRDGHATPECAANPSGCAGPGCCSGCQQGEGTCADVSPGATRIASARVDVFRWPPEGCTDATACSECGWCLAPGWETGCSLLVQVGVGYWRCNGQPVGGCHGQYLVPKACGKRCGVDQECDPEYAYQVALQQVNECAVARGWPTITGSYPPGHSVVYFDQECCVAPPL